MEHIGLGQLGLLRREAETGREVYTALSARLKETQIAGSLNTSNISIVGIGSPSAVTLASLT